MLTYHKIDPVLVSIGPFDIRWYSLAYIAGILLGGWYMNHLNRKLQLLKDFDALDNLLLWAVGGIIIGGRIGYVVFYHPSYYIEHPGEILHVWSGGMSFHGGLLGLIGAFYIFAKRHQHGFLSLMDLCACAAPIGLFFGRIANFINGELYGRITTSVPWAIIFPSSQEPAPRHPSQIYQALTEGLLLWVVLYLVVTKTQLSKAPGILSGIFLIGYGLSRFFVEFFREPDIHLGFIFEFLTMGQILCVPMIVLGITLITIAKKAKHVV